MLCSRTEAILFFFSRQTRNIDTKKNKVIMARREKREENPEFMKPESSGMAEQAWKVFKLTNSL